ncbi:Maf family protein [Paenibacillaceae bacterium WGS1546]|uniref:Maf family protein n=1 Tax=Cohnella sp. WGS1546 TaxID=3366810 RepID=UPI00372CF1EB
MSITALIKPEIVLASSSPRRQELIASLRLPVRIWPSRATEETPESWSPSRIVEELALRKAFSVNEEMKGPDLESPLPLIVGSDTIVVLDGEVLGKPRDEADAARMLRLLSGKTHEVFTGVACVPAGSEPPGKDVLDERGEAADRDVRYRKLEGGAGVFLAVGRSVTRMTFKTLSEDRILRYVRSGEPMDKAGAYGAQGLGATLIERIDGDFFGVVGLPLSLLSDMLLLYGLDIP